MNFSIKSQKKHFLQEKNAHLYIRFYSIAPFQIQVYKLFYLILLFYYQRISQTRLNTFQDLVAISFDSWRCPSLISFTSDFTVSISCLTVSNSFLITPESCFIV